MSPKKLPAAELMPHYEELLQAGAELPLVVSGISMTPFLRPGIDTVYLKKPEGMLRRGEIAFYHRQDGSHVLHRVWKTGNGMYWFLGDAQDLVEGPLPKKCVFAYVTKIDRDGVPIGPGDRLWKWFAGPWRLTRGTRRRIWLRLWRLSMRLRRERKEK